MATANQIKTGIGNYIERRMMPKLDSKRQFLLGMGYGICAGKLDALMQTVQQNGTLRAVGIVREDGEIDVDALYNAALVQMQAQKKLTIDVPLIGTFAFDETDLRELYEAIDGRNHG